ncbi:hypothetical protein ACEPAG_247 [Sanghuangporus baumii]
MSFPNVADMVHFDIQRLEENVKKRKMFDTLVEYRVAQDILGHPLDEPLEGFRAQFSVSDLDTLFSTSSLLNETPYLIFESLSNETSSSAAISIENTESFSQSESTKPKVSSTNAYILRPVTPGDWSCESEEPMSPPMAVDYSSGKSRDFSPKYVPRATSDLPTQEEKCIPPERIQEEEE